MVDLGNSDGRAPRTRHSVLNSQDSTPVSLELSDPIRSTTQLSSLTHSYRYCEQLAKREAGNFYHAFRLLPLAQRRSMSALYAFMRVTDDVADGPGELPIKRQALKTWRQNLDLALAGVYTHPLHAAFHHTVDAYHIPRSYFDAVMEGVGMDLEPVRFETFDDLQAYCY